MSTKPGVLCLVPDRNAVTIASNFIGCSRLSAGAESSGCIRACSLGRLSCSMSVDPNVLVGNSGKVWPRLVDGLRCFHVSPEPARLLAFFDVKAF